MTSLGRARMLLLVTLTLATLALTPDEGRAQTIVYRTVRIDCNQPGQTIMGALRRQVTGGGLTVQIHGTCHENVVINHDDVTLTTDGTPAAVVALNGNVSAIQVDGARRVVIDGKVADGFSVSGGLFGIVVTRGGSADVKNCHVSGATNTGIISSNSGTLAVDGCTVTGNANGVTASNLASAYVTNSTVSDNTATGLTAARASFLRVGQDRGGTAVLRPVMVSGNAANGIVITEGSAGIVVGGTVQNSGSTQIFVGRASSAEIGFGTSGLTGGVLIQNGNSNGISVEGGNATIVFSTITGNRTRGIVVNNGASARIGITNNNAVFGANTISGNLNDGIGIFHASSAYVGGNTITANSLAGINVGGAAASIVGGNTISDHPQSGILASRAAQVLVGDPGFGALSSANTISGNGTGGVRPWGGVYSFDGASMFVQNATIMNNVGPAVSALSGGLVDLRGTSVVTVPSSGTTPGAQVFTHGTLRLGDTASIVSATSDGVQIANLSTVSIENTNTVQGNGAGSFGARCQNFLPLVAPAATLIGTLTNVTGTAGSSLDCNVFP